MNKPPVKTYSGGKANYVEEPESWDLHSCSYYCERPGCIKAQRDELREKLFARSEWEEHGMTRDEIIRMANEAGLIVTERYGDIGGYIRFAELVAEHEREQCAKIADEVGDDDEDCHAWAAAAAIRARRK
jgi:hypothetical protein